MDSTDPVTDYELGPFKALKLYLWHREDSDMDVSSPFSVQIQTHKIMRYEKIVFYQILSKYKIHQYLDYFMEVSPFFIQKKRGDQEEFQRQTAG